VKPYKLLKDYFWVGIFAVFLAGSSIFAFEPGAQIYGNFHIFFIETMSLLPLMFILAGLFDVWVPKERIEKHIGPGSGVIGAFWVIVLATFQGGPLYGTFPVAYLLSKKGASVRNIFIYLGAFSCIKIPMLAFEIGFIGLKFSILRSLISLPVFIIIGIIMEKVVGTDYKVNKV
jgi:uncharacterized membrane protein YraQ (UPF0718 family)